MDDTVASQPALTPTPTCSGARMSMASESTDRECLLTRKALRLIITPDQRMCFMLSGLA